MSQGVSALEEPHHPLDSDSYDRHMQLKAFTLTGALHSASGGPITCAESLRSDPLFPNKITETDDPTYEQAMASNVRPHWIDARDQEMRNLDDFGVRQLIAADKVPRECDIYGTKLVCRRKRGRNNEHDKYKVRCVMLGNQLNAAEARKRKRAVAGGAAGAYVEPRVTAPTLRHSSFKCSAAVGVCKGMRRRCFVTLLPLTCRVRKLHARCMCALR
jgi:hypothetical protein